MFVNYLKTNHQLMRKIRKMEKFLLTMLNHIFDIKTPEYYALPNFLSATRAPARENQYD